MQRPVFYDESGRRKRLTLPLVFALILLILAAATAFAITIVDVPTPTALALNMERPRPEPLAQQVGSIGHAFLHGGRLREAHAGAGRALQPVGQQLGAARALAGLAERMKVVV